MVQHHPPSAAEGESQRGRRQERKEERPSFVLLVPSSALEEREKKKGGFDLFFSWRNALLGSGASEVRQSLEPFSRDEGAQQPAQPQEGDGHGQVVLVRGGGQRRDRGSRWRRKRRLWH